MSSALSRLSLIALQGHVVAEQQLLVPSDWIRDDDDAMPEHAPPPLGKPLQFTQEERGGRKVHNVTGANDLHVEVGSPSFCNFPGCVALATWTSCHLCSQEIMGLGYSEVVAERLPLCRRSAMCNA